MPRELTAFLVEEGARVVSDLIRVSLRPGRPSLAERQPPEAAPSPKKPERAPLSAPAGLTKPAVDLAEERPSTSKSPMPTTPETVADLKRRLAKELWRLESDLTTGGRIAGRPCDCFSKHSLGLEALSEELLTMDSSPVYSSILSWLDGHATEFRREEVSKHPPEHYRALAPEVRAFRKEIMGTEIPEPMSLDEAKKLAAERAAQEVEAKWHSVEKK